jgi:hypothetical protein
VFEIVIDGKVYRVEGKALQRWIVKRRSELNGPKGFLFNQRPLLEWPRSSWFMRKSGKRESTCSSCCRNPGDGPNHDQQMAFEKTCCCAHGWSHRNDWSGPVPDSAAQLPTPICSDPDLNNVGAEKTNPRIQAADYGD